MSGNTGNTIRKVGKKWVVYSVNMSTGHESKIGENTSRDVAIEMANNDWSEYGIVHIDPATPDPTAQHIISAINDYEFKVYGQVNDGKEKVQLEEFIRKLTKGEKP